MHQQCRADLGLEHDLFGRARHGHAAQGPARQRVPEAQARSLTRARDLEATFAIGEQGSPAFSPDS